MRLKITAQQAPLSVALHSLRLDASTTASNKNHPALAVTSQYKNKIVTTLSIELPTDENKFLYSQPTMPIVPGGGGKSG
jgi:hypothetical protein